MPIQAVLFDWDGVAVDSMMVVYRGCAAVLRRGGLPVPPYEEWLGEYEAPYLEFYRRRGLAATDEKIREWYFAEVGCVNNSRLFPDFPEVVRGLSLRGIFMGVVSGGLAGDIKTRLATERLLWYFGAVIGGKQVKDRAIKSFCSRWIFPPGEVAFVGDLVSDIRDGKKAGVITVAFTKNPDPQSRLLRAKPDHVITRHSELLKLV